MWREVSQLAQVEKEDFDAYYAGRTVAYAMRMADVWEHSRPVDLEALKARFPDFVVPQSWRYVRPEEWHFFRTLRRNAILNVQNRTALRGGASLQCGEQTDRSEGRKVAARTYR